MGDVWPIRVFLGFLEFFNLTRPLSSVLTTGLDATEIDAIPVMGVVSDRICKRCRPTLVCKIQHSLTPYSSDKCVF